MSRYTNDTDTLRQFISQSVIQTFSSAITLVVVFVIMLFQSVSLTLITIATTVLIMLCTKNVAGLSGKFFAKQQSSLGKVNGYIEEMVTGQKVVKVFCREDRARRISTA